MIKIQAYYYDGNSSAQVPVQISIDQSGTVLIKGESLQIETTINQLTIAARLANTPRHIYLKNGAKLETSDNESVDQICRYFESNRYYLILHRLEKNWHYVIASLLVTIAFVWGGIEYGVPVAAKWVVKGLPYQIEQDIGEQGLEALDYWLFSESELEKTEQQQLLDKFKTLVDYSNKSYDYRLVFRSSKQMGANALALPGGMIILTDGLVRLAENPQQILAVLAHEMGHIEFQHGIRSLLQNSITALFMAGVLGDITSVTSLSVALPTFLVESRYSREFELEADQYAIQFLKTQKIDNKQFSRILTLLEKTKEKDYEFDYLSSHPAMQKRIAIIDYPK